MGEKGSTGKLTILIVEEEKLGDPRGRRRGEGMDQRKVALKERLEVGWSGMKRLLWIFIGKWVHHIRLSWGYEHTWRHRHNNHCRHHFQLSSLLAILSYPIKIRGIARMIKSQKLILVLECRAHHSSGAIYYPNYRNIIRKRQTPVMRSLTPW